MWPVYLLSIFVEEAWASIPRVDAWGIASGMGDFLLGHSRLAMATNFDTFTKGFSKRLVSSYPLRE
jgi:hypothetical protein